MIEIPAVVLIAFLVMALFFGFGVGVNIHELNRDGRRKRALARVTPVWEVHVASDGTRDDYLGYVGVGRDVLVSARKVRRSGHHFEVLQRVEVARVRGDKDPDEILAAVDRAQALVNTLALTGAA